MSALETPIEVELVLQLGIEYDVEILADGFTLSGWGEGGGNLRGWPLSDVGALTTTDGNVVRLLGSSGCISGVVERPPADRAESVTGDVAVRLRWPCAATARVDRHQGRVRYGVDIGLDADPVRWLRLGAADAWVGVSVDGHLCAVIVEGRLPERVRVPLHLRAGGWSAALYAGSSFSASEPDDDDIEDDDGGEVLDHEEDVSEPHTVHRSDQGNASLSVAGGESPWLSVHDCRPGDPVAPDPAARRVDAVDGWQTWPADVRARSWVDDGRTWVVVRFGDSAVDETVRLGADTWVGSSMAGEIGVIIFGAVRDVPADDSDLDDFDDDPTAMRHLDTLLGPVEALGFDVYGIAGELGAPSGLGTTDGRPESLPIVYGTVEERRWATVTSARRGSSNARREVAAALVPPPDIRPGASPEELHALAVGEHARHRQVLDEILGREWQPATVTVAGEPHVFEAVRHGEGWGGLARIGGTTVTVVAQGREAAELRLERIADLAPYVDYARRRLREEMERRMPPEARRLFAERLAMPQAEKERRSAVRRVVARLMGALQRDAGPRRLGSLFTSRVVDSWGGRDRYEELLGLHTELRPVGGYSTRGDDPAFADDGSARFRVDLSHPLPSSEDAVAFMVFQSVDAGGDEPEPEPDRDAIRRGESHTITLTLVAEGEEWRIDTDLLAVLIDRLGTFEEVARPMPRA